MKKLLSVFLAFIILCGSAFAAPSLSGALFTLAEAAESASCGKGVSYSLDDAGNLTISGSGAIADDAFFEKSGIRTVTIPVTVTSVGSWAFAGCAELESVDISAKTIGSHAFDGCAALAGVTLSEGVQTIGVQAFDGDSGIKALNLPASVASVGPSAFAGCSGLEAVTVAADNEHYSAAGNCLIDKSSKTLILGCRNSVIPDDGSVAAIGSNAFKDCADIETVVIPDSVTSVGSAAFSGCSGLKAVTLPAHIDEINSYTFFGCSALEEVRIPFEVTTVGDFAFAGCEKLKRIYVPESTCLIEEHVFVNCGREKPVICAKEGSYAAHYAETHRDLVGFVESNYESEAAAAALQKIISAIQSFFDDLRNRDSFLKGSPRWISFVLKWTSKKKR
ncbi:MAG: leucine-rich repeat domain-containing protein [Clostridia bacterium]|nr:leucine-rich repeat domain-containing protein [Clostridia bacterium]